MIQFEVPGIPQGKQRVRVTQRGGYSVAYTPKNTVNYENLIEVCYKTQCKDKFFAEEPLVMTITAIYPIPKSMSKKRKEMALKCVLRPTTKPDIDNVIKVVCDALNKVAYSDDSHIVCMSIAKYYGIEPKLMINLAEVKENGIT